MVSYLRKKVCYSAQRELFCLTKLSGRHVTQSSWYVNELCVWSICRMTLTGEIVSALRNTYPIAVLFNTNPTRSDALWIDV